MAPAFIQIQMGKTWTIELQIISKNLANISIDYSYQYKLHGENSSANSSAKIKTYSTDVPRISNEVREGETTRVTLIWQPFATDLTGFVLYARDPRGGVSSWAPKVHYCLCEHSAATCKFTVNDSSVSTDIHFGNYSESIKESCEPVF